MRRIQVLGLVNDGGYTYVQQNGQSQWAVGTNIDVSNSQCTLHVGASTVSLPKTGKTLTVNLGLTFTAAFAGAKNIYMDTIDAGSHQANWEQKGNWTAIGPPTVVSMVPASGSGAAQTFTLTVADVAGAANISYAYLLVNASLSASGGCFVEYNHVANTFRLENDAGSGWLGPITLGTTASVSNSQCTITGNGAYSNATGNNLTVTIPTSFAAGFAGAKTTFGFAFDNVSTGSGWVTTGTWTVPVQYLLTTTISPGGSGTVSASPTSGTGYYSAGTVVQLTAAANSGYVFDHWSGALSGTANPQSVTMSGPVSVTAYFTDPFQHLISCVSASGGPGSTCTLPTGTYTISQPIVIGRSNVTVTGGSTNRSQTILVRDPAFTGPMMDVNASQPLTGVKIQYLTFCGNSTLNPSAACPPPAQTNCASGAPCTDLYIHNADTGLYPTNPFASTPPPTYSVEIANVDLEGATGHAIALFPDVNLGGRVNDIYIHGSAINGSTVTGILLGANGAKYLGQDYYGRLCDSILDFDYNPNLGLPRNIRIENNTFQNNNINAIEMNGGARWIGLRSNYFINNYTYIYPVPGKGNRPELRGK